MRLVALSLTVLALASCAPIVRMDARHEMEKSKAAYKNCLTQNAANIGVCEGLRLAYQADLEAYQSTMGTGATIGIRNE